MHVLGSKMTIPDALSRWPDHNTKGDTEEEMVTMLPDHLFLKEELTVQLRSIDLTWRTHLRKGLVGEHMVANSIKALKKEGPTPIGQDLSNWEIDKGLVYYKGWSYVPTDENL